MRVTHQSIKDDEGDSCGVENNERARRNLWAFSVRGLVVVSLSELDSATHRVVHEAVGYAHDEDRSRRGNGMKRVSSAGAVSL